MRHKMRVLLCSTLLTISIGCTEIRETAPDRTANEQLLISTAADRAIERLTFGLPANAQVLLRTAHFESYDETYVVGGVRQKLAREGARLVDSRDQADFIVELRSGALSINQRRDYIGFGGFEVPVPLSEAVQLPLASFYEENNQTGLAKLVATTYEAETQTFFYSSGPVFGISWIDKSTLLGVGWRDTNVVPEKFEGQPRPQRMGQYKFEFGEW